MELCLQRDKVGGVHHGTDPLPVTSEISEYVLAVRVTSVTQSPTEALGPSFYHFLRHPASRAIGHVATEFFERKAFVLERRSYHLINIGETNLLPSHDDRLCEVDLILRFFVDRVDGIPLFSISRSRRQRSVSLMMCVLSGDETDEIVRNGNLKSPLVLRAQRPTLRSQAA